MIMITGGVYLTEQINYVFILLFCAKMARGPYKATNQNGSGPI